MKIIKRIIENLTAEDEVSKAILLEKEETSKIQDKHIDDMICPICGNKEFNNSVIIVDGVHGGSVKRIISFNKGLIKKYKVKGKVCVRCGFILIFADMNTLQIEGLEDVK